jgi:hypothetical protein
MKIELPVKFSQFDPLWAKKLLGHNTDPHYDFYNYACLLCKLAEVANYFGHNETPLTLNEKLKANGGYVNGGEYVNGKFSELFPDIQEKSVPTPAALTNEQLAEIRQALDAGFPVVLGIDYDPKTLKFDSHFVLASDYDPNDENNFTIVDSLGGRVHSLKDYLGSAVPTIRQSVWKYFIFQGTVPVKANVSQPIAPAASPASALPENYPQIVHGSTQWKEIVKVYFPDRKPEEIFFQRDDFSDDLKRRIESKVRVEEKIVEKEVIKEVPIVTAESVPTVTSEGHASEQWNQLVVYLELEKVPSQATFEDVKRVVAGIKSRQTDLENKARTATTDSAKKDTVRSNLEGDIIRLQKELIQQEKLNKAQIDSLKKTQPDFTSLTRQYDSVIKELKADLGATVEELKQARVEVTVSHAEGNPVINVSTGSRSFSIPGKQVIDLIKKYLRLKW